NVETGGILAPCRAEELAPRGDPPEQALDPDPRTGWERSRPFRDQCSVIDDAFPTLRRVPRAAFQSQLRDTGDRRQSFAPKAERCHLLDGFVGEFRCRVALERKADLLWRHPAAIVGHF